jgi:hypothetical protein
MGDAVFPAANRELRRLKVSDKVRWGGRRCGGRCNSGMTSRHCRKWIGEGGQHRCQNSGKSRRRKDKAEDGPSPMLAKSMPPT